MTDVPASEAFDPGPVPPVPPVRLTNVRYQYAGSRTWVLDEITLSIEAGRVMAVVGANDSGKSTLALVVSGLAPGVIAGRLEGTVELAGARTVDLRPHEAAQRCGVLFQNPPNQLSGTTHTVWEEVAFGPRNIGLTRDEIAERVEHALAAVRIAHLAPRDPARLSGGQAQLVALASVLALRPRCLVLDEPTSQLDPEGTRLVGDSIRGLAEAGVAVLLIEHKTELLAAVADQAIALDGGRIVLAGSASDVLRAPELERLGVDPPPHLRVGRALAAAGLDEAVVGEALEAGTRRPGAVDVGARA